MASPSEISFTCSRLLDRRPEKTYETSPKQFKPLPGLNNYGAKVCCYFRFNNMILTKFRVIRK